MGVARLTSRACLVLGVDDLEEDGLFTYCLVRLLLRSFTVHQQLTLEFCRCFSLKCIKCIKCFGVQAQIVSNGCVVQEWNDLWVSLRTASVGCWTGYFIIEMSLQQTSVYLWPCARLTTTNCEETRPGAFSAVGECLGAGTHR